MTSGTRLTNLAQKSIGKFALKSFALLGSIACVIQKGLIFRVMSVFMSDVLVNVLQRMQSEHLRESVDSRLSCL